MGSDLFFCVLMVSFLVVLLNTKVSYKRGR